MFIKKSKYDFKAKAVIKKSQLRSNHFETSRINKKKGVLLLK